MLMGGEANLVPLY